MGEIQARRHANEFVVQRYGYQLPLLDVHVESGNWHFVYDALGPNGARFDDDLVIVVDGKTDKVIEQQVAHA